MYGFYYSQDKSTMILVRVNGKGTDLFLQRVEEVILPCRMQLNYIYYNGIVYPL